MLDLPSTKYHIPTYPLTSIIDFNFRMFTGYDIPRAPCWRSYGHRFISWCFLRYTWANVAFKLDFLILTSKLVIRDSKFWAFWDLEAEARGTYRQADGRGAMHNAVCQREPHNINVFVCRHALYSGRLRRRNCGHHSTWDGFHAWRSSRDLQGYWRTSRLCWSVHLSLAPLLACSQRSL